jgi:AcrR family transcriptional regulator
MRSVAKRKATAGNADAKLSPDKSRKTQLVQIAFDHIAARGFEGLRFQDVAKAAGINNATLYYHFPSKEALIRGVVESLMERLEAPLASRKEMGGALAELRQLFENTRRRLARDPAFFIVITELALRAKRDPVVDEIGKGRDDFWARHITAIIERGIAEGVFRRNLNVNATVTSLMAQLKGIAHHATMRKRKRGEIEGLLSEISAQVEHWLTCREQGAS